MSNSPNVKIGCVSNMYTRMMHFGSKGDIEYGHSHPFDHLTLLSKGKLGVTVKGEYSEFTAPHMIYIKKDIKHELVALENDTIAFCIHALRVGEAVEDILDPDSIPKGVSPTSISLPLTN